MKKKSKKKSIIQRNYIITDFKIRNIIFYEKMFYNNTEIIRYLVIQLEEGDETKREHYQIYIELYKPQRYNRIKKMFDNDGLHIEDKSKWSTRLQARYYCMKNHDGIYNEEYKWIEPLHRGRKWNDKYYEFGEWIKGQGARKDVNILRDIIKDGGNIIDITEQDFSSYLKWNRGFEKYYNIQRERLTKNFRIIKVEVIWGKGGTNKSRMALYKDDDTPKDDIFVLYKRNSGNIWWDGYRDQKTIVINDFYGGWMSWGYFLNVCDGHQMPLDIKGGTGYANWTKVIITSNKHPKEWYSMGTDYNGNMVIELSRRLTKITHVTK